MAGKSSRVSNPKTAQNKLMGSCLCGQIRYRINGHCRNIIRRYCDNYRRTNAYLAAYTLVDKSDLVLISEQSLKCCYDNAPNIYRGLCRNCGFNLSWQRGNSNYLVLRNQLSVAAGTLDSGHDLQTAGDIYALAVGEYYKIEYEPPQFNASKNGKLEVK